MYSSEVIDAISHTLQSRQKRFTRLKNSRTYVERQRESRQKIFNSHRFNTWTDTSDGYESDDSSNSYASHFSYGQLSQINVWDTLCRCNTDINCESIINVCVAALSAQIDHLGEDFDAITQVVDMFFDRKFLNKMSQMIATKTLDLIVQCNVLKMFDKMVASQELSDRSVDNLMQSLMIPKLIEAIYIGSEALVENSLKLLMTFLYSSPSRLDLLEHIFKCGFVEVLYHRTSPLKWRSPKTKSRDCSRQRRPQVMTVTSLSLTSQKLFRNFSQAINQVANFDVDDGKRIQLLELLVPLFHQLLSCPDKQVLNNTVNCLIIFVQKNPNNVCLIQCLVKNFGHTLVTMITNKDDSTVLATMQFINTIFESFPDLDQEFGSQLMNALNVLSHRDDQKLNKEVIVLLSSLTQRISLMNDKSRPMLDRLLHLSLIMLKSAASSGERFNVQSSLLIIESLLNKYHFQSFVQLIVSSQETVALLGKMLASSNQTINEIVAKIIVQIQAIIDSTQIVWPEGALKSRQTLFDCLSSHIAAR